MAFNADEFRSKAKAAGLSDEDIDSEIGYQSGSSKDAFAKGKDGFELSSKEAIHERVGNDWWHLPAASAAGAAAASGAWNAGKAAWDWITSKNNPPESRIEPTMAPEPIDRLQQAKERILAGQQAGIGVQPPAAPSAPVAASLAQSPVAPAEPATPSATEAVASGQSPSKAVQMDVATQLDEASGIAPRVRRTKAQIEQATKESFANAPSGMLPSAPAKTNKWPGDVIGQGGWHWFEGQGGTPEEWTRQYGRTNQPYQRVVSDVKGGILGVPPKPEGAKGGTVPRKEHVPEYIKGSIGPAMAMNLAANALGGLGLAQAYKEGKKTGDWTNLGLGAIDQILGNVVPKASLAMSLMAPSTTNAGEKEELAKRRKMKPTVD